MNKTLLTALLIFLFSLFSQTSFASNPLLLVSGSASLTPLITKSADWGNDWENVFISNLPRGGVNLFDCTADADSCIGIITIPFMDFKTRLFLGHNKANDWESFNLPGLTNSIKLNAVKCTGAGANATCFIAGYDRGNSGKQLTPKLWILNAAKKSWSQPLIKDMPANGILNIATCTDKTADAVCVITGSGFMLVSQDGGKTWSVTNTPYPVKSIEDMSCTGHGSQAVCVGVGFRLHSIAVTQDGGATWKAKAIKDLTAPIFRGISCAGQAPNTVCIVEGYTYDTPKQDGSATSSFMAVSSDNGENWVVNTPAMPQFKGNFGAVNCVDNGNGNVVCVATGGKVDGEFVLAHSTDNAKTWVLQKLPQRRHIGMDWPGYQLSDIRCQIKDTKVACAILGFAVQFLDWYPVILITNDITNDSESAWASHYLEIDPSSSLTLISDA